MKSYLIGALENSFNNSDCSSTLRFISSMGALVSNAAAVNNNAVLVINPGLTGLTGFLTDLLMSLENGMN